MQIAAVEAGRLDAAYDVVIECRLALAACGLFQWDERYPSRSFFHAAAAVGTLFALSDKEQIQGVVVLDESQASEWSAIAWRDSAGRPLIIHALAVAPSAQGRGHGRTLLTYCEEFATGGGYTSIRLDAFSENHAALSLYERHGYQRRGSIRFASKPLGHQKYYCYEKTFARELCK